MGRHLLTDVVVEYHDAAGVLRRVGIVDDEPVDDPSEIPADRHLTLRTLATREAAIGIGRLWLAEKNARD